MVGIIMSIIGLTAGFSAGGRISERVVHAAVSAAASEIRGSTYAPIIAAAITGSTAILCAILLPVVTLITLNRLNRKDSHADLLVANAGPINRIDGARSADRVIDCSSELVRSASDSRLDGPDRPADRLQKHNRQRQ